MACHLLYEGMSGGFKWNRRRHHIAVEEWDDRLSTRLLLLGRDMRNSEEHFAVLIFRLRRISWGKELFSSSVCWIHPSIYSSRNTFAFAVNLLWILLFSPVPSSSTTDDDIQASRSSFNLQWCYKVKFRNDVTCKLLCKYVNTAAFVLILWLCLNSSQHSHPSSMTHIATADIQHILSTISPWVLITQL